MPMPGASSAVFADRGLAAAAVSMPALASLADVAVSAAPAAVSRVGVAALSGFFEQPATISRLVERSRARVLGEARMRTLPKCGSGPNWGVGRARRFMSIESVDTCYLPIR